MMMMMMMMIIIIIIVDTCDGVEKFSEKNKCRSSV